MPKPRPSVLKRQREQGKREKELAKAERKEQRKRDREAGIEEEMEPVVRERPLEPDAFPENF